MVALMYGLILTLVLAAAAGAEPPPDPTGCPFLLTRGSTDPAEEVVYFWSGEIYARIDADPLAEPVREWTEPLLRFEGYNVARFLPLEEPCSVRMVSREVSLYLDPDTGEVLRCWTNPFTGAQVPVVHVFNDPVNASLGDLQPRAEGEQRVFSFVIPLKYPSPLPVDGYGAYSAGNTYESTEIFDFSASADDLTRPGSTSAPATISWTRVGQWLPWMQMGQRPGRLVYHVTGHKLAGGIAALPGYIRDHVTSHAPEFLRAPEADAGDNVTSWGAFRELVESGAYSPSCVPTD